MLNDLEKYMKLYRYYGMLANIGDINTNKELLNAANTFLKWEISERNERKLNSAIKNTRLKKYGGFDLLQDFDWNWPKKIDKETILELCNLKFIKEHTNIVLIGSSGVGKTTIAKNIVHLAACSGYSSVFVEAADMLDDLLSEELRGSIRFKLEKYAKPDLLAIDEVGYLSYNTKHADILFQLIQKRSRNKSTMITTNRPFGEWSQLFPNAASVNALIDRIIERCKVIQIEAETYRGKRFTDRKKEKEERLKSLKK